MPQYYTVKEVARMVKKHVKTIYRWIAEGRLPARRISDGYLIEAAALRRAAKKVETGER